MSFYISTKERYEWEKRIKVENKHPKRSNMSHSSRHRRAIRLNCDIFPSGPGWAPRLHRRLGSTMDQTKDPGSHDHALSPPPLRSVDGGNAFTKLPLSTGNSSSRGSFHSVCTHTCGRPRRVHEALHSHDLFHLSPSLSLSREAIINGRLRAHQRNAGDVF